MTLAETSMWIPPIVAVAGALAAQFLAHLFTEHRERKRRKADIDRERAGLYAQLFEAVDTVVEELDEMMESKRRTSTAPGDALRVYRRVVIQLRMTEQDEKLIELTNSLGYHFAALAEYFGYPPDIERDRGVYAIAIHDLRKHTGYIRDRLMRDGMYRDKWNFSVLTTDLISDWTKHALSPDKVHSSG